MCIYNMFAKNRIAVLTIIIVLYINKLGALRPLANHRRYVDTDLDDEKVLKTSLQLLRAVSKIQNSRRVYSKFVDAKEKIMKGGQLTEKYNSNKKYLRDGNDEEVSDAHVIEQELMHTLLEDTPEVLRRPVVEKNGINDFLVMKSDHSDPYVTVIPNAIYYNIEKKCVNWLDDCSVRGIRSKLLKKVNWPAK